MKKILLVLSAIALTACSQAQEKTEKLINDTKESYDNVANKVEETVDDIQEASQKVEDAKNAVSEIAN